MISEREGMLRALALARRGGADVHPNPRVGCVLLRDGRVVGEGWHRRFGGPHAEVEALARAGASARGATALVTLEPCSHHGKTPPCADALIAAGVRRVVAALEDPNPRVAGRGLRRLAEAGLDVEVGLLADEARAQNRPFLRFMTTGLPFVTAKIAATLDGKVADHRGASRWITGPEARREGHRLRREHRAVVTGIGTVLADDPALTVRDVPRGWRDPARVVLDTHLRLPREALLVRTARDVPTLVLCGPDARPGSARALGDLGVEVLSAPLGADGRVSLAAALRVLAARELSPLLLEAGGVLTSAFFSAGLVDDVAWFVAPTVLACHAAQPALDLAGPRDLAARLHLVETSMRRVGTDWLLRAHVARESAPDAASSANAR
jgi:diaminohydroxyphosphoribosylaminopyrimidine deaminase/5-amino-6-(5-phosphoribosylamino)uracil reductase